MERLAPRLDTDLWAPWLHEDLESRRRQGRASSPTRPAHQNETLLCEVDTLGHLVLAGSCQQDAYSD